MSVVESSIEVALPEITYEKGYPFEPTLAVGDGVVYATVSNVERLYRWTGGDWDVLPSPEVPGMPGVPEGDMFVTVDDRGGVWWSSLVWNPDAEAVDSVHIARSDDHGETWPVNRRIYWPLVGDITVSPDRQWVTVQGDRVAFLFAETRGTTVFYGVSDDYGQTFEGPLWLHEVKGMVGTIGPLKFGPDGVLVTGFFSGAQGMNLDGSTQALAVTFLASQDGASWTRKDITLRPAGPLQGDGGYLFPLEGAVGNGFPGILGDEEGFMAAWQTAYGALVTAESQDGTEWVVTTGPKVDGLAAVYPNPWPWRTDGAKGAVWTAKDPDGAEVLVASSFAGEVIHHVLGPSRDYSVTGYFWSDFSYVTTHGGLVYVPRVEARTLYFHVFDPAASSSTL